MSAVDVLAVMDDWIIEGDTRTMYVGLERLIEARAAVAELMEAVNNGVPTEKDGKLGVCFHPVHAESLRAAYARCKGEGA